MARNGPTKEQIFRVLSFNVRGGGCAPYYLGARRSKRGPGIHRIGLDILGQTVDLAGLQEVFHVPGSSGSRHHLHRIFRSNSMDTSWGRATALATPIAAGNMNVINTSVFEVVEHRQFVLASRLTTFLTLGLNYLFDYTQRSAQYSLLRLPARGERPDRLQQEIHINFINVHLDFTAHRKAEGDLLLHHIERLRETADHTILVGDFNEEPKGDVIRQILQWGFMDSMDGSDLSTFRHTNQDLMPKYTRHGKRIDYIFFTPDNHRGGSSSVELRAPGSVVLNAPGGTQSNTHHPWGQQLSDHYGVLAEFRMRDV